MTPWIWRGEFMRQAGGGLASGGPVFNSNYALGLHFLLISSRIRRATAQKYRSLSSILWGAASLVI